MINKFKRASNSIRQILGASPTIVTTSTFEVDVTYNHPELPFLGKKLGRAFTSVEKEQVYFVATPDGRRNTQNALWNVDFIIKDREYDPKRIKANVTFNQMADFIRNAELNVAERAGFRGTDEEIIAQRSKAVPRSNILRLKQ